MLRNQDSLTAEQVTCDTALLAIVLAGGLFAAELSATNTSVYVKYLASENMRGRATGSPELEKAAGFIRDQVSLA